MSIWLMISIGCMFADPQFRTIKYCEADRSKVFITKKSCEDAQCGSCKCIEFKKGDYWITYPMKGGL